MFLRSAALLLALLPIGFANAAAPSTNIDLCTDLYRQAVDRQLQRKGGRPPKPADELALAYGSWLVAQRTGVASYRDYAVAVYDRLIQLKVDGRGQAVSRSLPGCAPPPDGAQAEGVV
jgi:hypothetical protein